MRVGIGVRLRSLPELGVGIIVSSRFDPKVGVIYLVEWPKDPETGLQSKREVRAREIEIVR